MKILDSASMAAVRLARTSFFFVVLAVAPVAQLFGPEQLVTDAADGAQWVSAADLDGDGDVDVLSASEVDHRIAWYENLDGQGSFGAQRTITTSALQAYMAIAADLNGDGALDVLSASLGDDTIAWYENLGGAVSFSGAQCITTETDGAVAVHAADLDGDGDLDVLSASVWDDEIAWYRNLDGLGTFGPQLVISDTADGAFSVFAADLDGDGDQDVLSASEYDDEVVWYRNVDGAGTFVEQQVLSSVADGASSVCAADLDGDGDLDALSASLGDDSVFWYENDGAGSFGAGQLVSSAVDAAQLAVAADLDADGDLDVVSASPLADTVAWHENLDGLGAFGPPQVISAAADGANSVFAADLDGDGDPDVLSAAHTDDKIAWYESYAPAIRPHGCGVNPPGSLTVVSGTPALGATVVLGLDNPLGTQAPGSIPIVAVASVPAPGAPCGVLLPGLGMEGAGAPGELLLGLEALGLIVVGAPWGGPGQPAQLPLGIPPSASLVGVSLFAQGVLLDTATGTAVKLALTQGLELRVGP